MFGLSIGLGASCSPHDNGRGSERRGEWETLGTEIVVSDVWCSERLSGFKCSLSVCLKLPRVGFQGDMT